MATTKKTTVNKNQSAGTKKSTTVTNNPTRVVCPECGAEFDILADHEHTAKNVTVLGADSGLGTIYLPVSKRAEALNKAGIGTKKYFSMNALDGSECLMTYDEDGRPVQVNENDPIIRQIIGGGTVPNKYLFRRWIMSQVFHWLMDKDQAAWLNSHGYDYQWKMFIEELRMQTKLAGRDLNNFMSRNRWYNKELAVAMAKDYCEQLAKCAKKRKQHLCKNVPYITYDHKDYFLTDIDKKLVGPVLEKMKFIQVAHTITDLYVAVKNFWESVPRADDHFRQCPAWKDAFKGTGAYFTMQNLLRFHGCTFPKNNEFYARSRTGLDMLERAANCYAGGEGWRLFGLMKQMIEENHIDIEDKMHQWAKEKEARHLRR